MPEEDPAGANAPANTSNNIDSQWLSNDLAELVQTNQLHGRDDMDWFDSLHMFERVSSDEWESKSAEELSTLVAERERALVVMRKKAVHGLVCRRMSDLYDKLRGYDIKIRRSSIGKAINVIRLHCQDPSEVYTPRLRAFFSPSFSEELYESIRDYEDFLSLVQTHASAYAESDNFYSSVLMLYKAIVEACSFREKILSRLKSITTPLADPNDFRDYSSFWSGIEPELWNCFHEESD